MELRQLQNTQVSFFPLSHAEQRYGLCDAHRLTLVSLYRSQTFQRAQLQIQQIHHPQRSLSLLPRRESQRNSEKQDS